MSSERDNHAPYERSPASSRSRSDRPRHAPYPASPERTVVSSTRTMISAANETGTVRATQIHTQVSPHNPKRKRNLASESRSRRGPATSSATSSTVKSSSGTSTSTVTETSTRTTTDITVVSLHERAHHFTAVNEDEKIVGGGSATLEATIKRGANVSAELIQSALFEKGKGSEDSDAKADADSRSSGSKKEISMYKEAHNFTIRGGNKSIVMGKQTHVKFTFE